MTDPLIPQTKLDAVNLMLASIGQTPLNTLNTAGIRDAAIAELTLDMTLRSVLVRGWSFNSDYDFEILPDVNDNHLVPSDALSITPCDHWKDYVERDNGGTRMMYDRENNTFVITESEEYNIIRAMDFASIPEAARGYVSTRAARLFQANTIASDIIFKYTELHERESFAALRKVERKNKKLNMFKAGTEANAVIHRTYNPTR